MQNSANDQLQTFIHYLQAEKRASEHTVSSYQRDLQRLQQFCDEQQLERWGAIQPGDIRQHIANRHRKGIGSTSLQRH